ncbi:MAG: glycoside hydrolase family 88 protein [Verrucomicrobiota bacterium]
MRTTRGAFLPPSTCRKIRWRASLLDPESYPVKETSGSGFYCYGLAWGINNGLLDRATALPHVEKAWAAPAACVTPEGKLTHVQPVGADPRHFEPESTAPYGVGAFLQRFTSCGSTPFQMNPVKRGS